jgi:OOP family OmpA-OmpF porin
MRILTGLSAIGLSAALLAGCAGVTSSDFNKQKLPADKTFNACLAQGFQDLSRTTYGEGNYTQADIFAEKGRAAAAGNPAEPSAVVQMNMPSDKVSELQQARSRLIAALGKPQAKAAPCDAARCQIMYECWLHEQQQNWSFQAKQIASCKAGFDECIRRLEFEEKAAMPPVTPPASFQVFFDFDKYNLRPEAPDVLKQFIAFAKKENIKKIRVVGHTDTVGSKAYNLRLSQRRAETVKKFLIDNGLKDAEITTVGVAFTDLLVPTPPGVPELKNRRAQVLFQKPGS